ncbi:hypothetical protein N7532_009890 [Penicillium argentinense]|uniref:Ubiquitin-conjugating enzyme E2 Z n=1 Tax=Penicillium argentinense TaxID=1131581 RepID=A0A9W9ENV7_9EURO|nr:uncharacterized protein N7532_009890 [Penicillium argentinense]KAJ5085119.1 hypothetical protein N7532_009890 [Penicillium argentinense]
MASRSLLRLMKELQELAKGENLAINVHYDESNINQIEVLLLGPPDTPYAFGFYRFAIVIPPEYPTRPPHVTLKTTNMGSTRFGPNLYASGKVCLSILGTWPGRPGEEWSPAQGLESVLLSIQSLLSANPYHNEPGFAHESDANAVQTYNAKVRHENLRLAIITPLEKALGLAPNPTGGPSSASSEDPFNDHYKRRFLWYLDQYKRAIAQGIEEVKNNPGPQFPMAPFESSSNGMRGSWAYPELQRRLQAIESKLIEETYGWAVEGSKICEEDAGIAVTLRAQQDQIVAELKNFTGSTVDLAMIDDNPFLWQLTYFGRPMSIWDGAMVNLKIYISPRFPAEQPRVFLDSSIFHLRVTSLKMLVYLPARSNDLIRHIAGIIGTLDEESPAYNPLLTVNQEASKLFWGTKQEKREYNTKLRHSIEMSML